MLKARCLPCMHFCRLHEILFLIMLMMMDHIDDGDDDDDDDES